MTMNMEEKSIGGEYSTCTILAYQTIPNLQYYIFITNRGLSNTSFTFFLLINYISSEAGKSEKLQ